MWQDITEKDKNQFNKVITHPLQSYEWGEFRKATGIQVVRKGFFQPKTSSKSAEGSSGPDRHPTHEPKLTDAFQLTIHKIPHTPWTIGYLPKGNIPTPELIKELKKIGQENKCIFIQLEPNIKVSDNSMIDPTLSSPLKYAAHPLFTQYTFELNLTQSEEEILKNMHQKTRYNIRVAEKHTVEIKEENSKEAFDIYWQLTKETTQRQGFFAHTQKYHELMWQNLGKKNPGGLEAHLFIARYLSPESKVKIPLVAWILFTFQNKLYYPYGASSSLYRNVMASNLMMWEAIKFGKRLGLKIFDMWGSMGENPDTKDPWYGFHRLKQGYGPLLVKFVGSYDLVINPLLYQGYKVIDKLRWVVLKITK